MSSRSRLFKSFSDQVADDIINDFVLLFDKYVSRFDTEKSNWPTFIRERFRWYRQDCSHLRHNQPMGKHVTRGVVRFQVVELNRFDRTDGDRQSDLASKIESSYRDHHSESARFDELLETMNLSPRTNQILRNYFVNSFTMRECAEDVGLSESRVSQLITAAFTKIKLRTPPTASNRR